MSRFGKSVASVLALSLVAMPGSAAAAPEDLEDAAVMYRAMTTATAASDREIAQYRLAVSLHRAGLVTASFAFFSEIAEHPAHARFHETLPWLATLAAELPEPADVIERLAKYREAEVEAYAAKDPALHARLAHLLGQYRYRNHEYEESIRDFATIPADSALRPSAMLRSGAANVQLRRPAEAIACFEEVVRTVAAHERPRPTRSRPESP